MIVSMICSDINDGAKVRNYSQFNKHTAEKSIKYPQYGNKNAHFSVLEKKISRRELTFLRVSDDLSFRVKVLSRYDLDWRLPSRWLIEP